MRNAGLFRVVRSGDKSGPPEPAPANANDQVSEAGLAWRAKWGAVVGIAAMMLSAALIAFFFFISSRSRPWPLTQEIVVFFVLAGIAASVSIAAIVVSRPGCRRTNTFNRSLALVGCFLGLISLVATVFTTFRLLVLLVMEIPISPFHPF